MRRKRRCILRRVERWRSCGVYEGCSTPASTQTMAVHNGRLCGSSVHQVDFSVSGAVVVPVSSLIRTHSIRKMDDRRTLQKLKLKLCHRPLVAATVSVIKPSSVISGGTSPQPKTSRSPQINFFLKMVSVIYHTDFCSSVHFSSLVWF